MHVKREVLSDTKAYKHWAFIDLYSLKPIFIGLWVRFGFLAGKFFGVKIVSLTSKYHKHTQIPI